MIALHYDPRTEDAAACGAFASLGHPLGLTSDPSLVTCADCELLLEDAPDDGLPGSPEYVAPAFQRVSAIVTYGAVSDVCCMGLCERPGIHKVGGEVYYPMCDEHYAATR